MVPKKTVIITGSSSGIGRSLAIEMAKRKYNIVLAARKMDLLQSVKDECESSGVSVLCVKTDVSNENECSSLMQAAFDHFGGIDILINNAGITMSDEFSGVGNLDIFKELININYLGTVYCTYHALQYLKKSKGQIVGISSLQGISGFPFSSGYAASKSAMQGFLESIRLELAPYNINILIAYPGPVATERLLKRVDSNGKNSVPKGMMSESKCARLIAKATDQRKYRLIMTGGGKLMPLLKAIAPSLLDAIILKKVRKFYGLPSSTT